MLDDLMNHVGALGLDKYRTHLSRIARPSVEILVAKTPPTIGCSKFGGMPDLPAGFEWPQHKLGPYRFIGQFHLGDLPAGPLCLPETGLLSFFYAHDDNGESFWGDPDYVRAYRFDRLDALGPVAPPEAVRFGATTTLSFQLGADVPPWPWDDAAIEQWPINETQRDAYWELRCKLHPSGRYLGGYPFNTSLAYDPTPSPEWRSLLTLASDHDLAWCWHDDDWLVTFIEEQRLQAADFSRIRSDAG